MKSLRIAGQRDVLKRALPRELAKIGLRGDPNVVSGIAQSTGERYERLHITAESERDDGDPQLRCPSVGIRRFERHVTLLAGIPYQFRNSEIIWWSLRDRVLSEHVMVVDTAALEPFLRARTFDLIRDDAQAILDLVSSRHFFVPRAEAEVEPRWRQIIPYVVILHENDVFVLRRTRKQTEARLHDKVSLGIGGHVNPGHDLMAGLEKELHEEVSLDSLYQLESSGIINDESTEVGRVHLGAVYVLRPATPEVRVRETEKMTGSWVARHELGVMRDAMESWSQIVYDAMMR